MFPSIANINSRKGARQRPAQNIHLSHQNVTEAIEYFSYFGITALGTLGQMQASIRSQRFDHVMLT